MRRQRATRYCVGRNQNGDECLNDARQGEDTCRWHDPTVLAARREAEEAKERLTRAVAEAS